MNIFIDTNLYYSHKFNFNTFPILGAINYCEGFDVRILVTNVQRMEIEKKIEIIARR